MKINSSIAYIIVIVLGLISSGLVFSCAQNFPVYANYQNIIIHTEIHFPHTEDKDFFETAYLFSEKDFTFSEKEICAGVIPHHLLAADLIAEFFHNLENKDYDTIVLIGPNHFNYGESKIIISKYNWNTPYGILENDLDFSSELLTWNEINVEEDIILNEHSVYSEIPFIKRTFENAKIVPIILKPDMNEAQSELLAKKIYNIAKGQDKKILLLASVDFSHYKDSDTAQVNDKESIYAIENFDFDNIYNLDIDSPSSIYTLLKFSNFSNAEFKLINNSNSAILAEKPELDSTTSYVTGYFIKK